MLILDADSIMRAASVQLMADRMAVEPGLGLIQTVPRVLAGHTLWQRMQYFASEVYGTNLGRGFAIWTGAEGNLLGHNAPVGACGCCPRPRTALRTRRKRCPVTCAATGAGARATCSTFAC